MDSLCDWVHGFADGELPPALRQAFCLHLVACTRCQASLEMIFGLKALAETASGL